MNIKKQKAKTDWVDEAGNLVAWDNLKKTEKVNEQVTYDIAKAASKVSMQLVKLRATIQAKIDAAVKQFHADYTGKKKPEQFKGNYTIFNFDRSIKVEISVSNPIQFDDLTINTAKDMLHEFLKDGLSAKNAALKDMVLDAFNTTRGKLDVKKILALQKYKDRIDDKRYRKAMDLISSAIRRPSTCTYYKVSVRDESGKYKYIPLALADV